MVELPIVTGTYGTKPARTALALVDGEGDIRPGHLNRLISCPQAAAATAEDVETGPVIDWRDGRRSFRVRTRGKIGCIRRSGQRRHGGQSEQNLFHSSIPSI